MPIRQVAGWVSDKVEPPISPIIERLTSDDGRAYIRVAFSGIEGPYSADGRYFIRVGTSNKAMTASELSAMIIRRDATATPGTHSHPAGPSPTLTRRRCAISSGSETRRGASPPDSQTCEVNSQDSSS